MPFRTTLLVTALSLVLVVGLGPAVLDGVQNAATARAPTVGRVIAKIFGTPFERHFDESLRGARLPSAMAFADANWRRVAMSESESAFNIGGWDAATDAIDNLLNRSSERRAGLLLSGDDVAIYRYVEAEMTAVRAILPIGNGCRSWMYGDYKYLNSNGEVASFLNARNNAEADAIISSLRNQYMPYRNLRTVEEAQNLYVSKLENASTWADKWKAVRQSVPIDTSRPESESAPCIRMFVSDQLMLEMGPVEAARMLRARYLAGWTYKGA